MLAVNPKALEDAEARDRERAAGQVRGPLHGIPIALKDNVNTSSLPTTGGALAFDGLVPPYDATLTKNLLDAGAIIIAKTMMTELANWVTNGMPGNYNALGGYGFNPYDPRRDPRGPMPQAAGGRRGGPAPRFDDGRPALGTGGSSSGTGTAANFWAANVGTETSGSILSPSNQNMLAGIKPTVAHQPLRRDSDYRRPGHRRPDGPAPSPTPRSCWARSRPGARPDDPATGVCQPPPNRDYTVHLKADALAGARIGIPRANYYDPVTLPGEKEPRGGLNAAQKAAMDEAIAVLHRRAPRSASDPEHRRPGSVEELPAVGHLRRPRRRARQGRELLVRAQAA